MDRRAEGLGVTPSLELLDQLRTLYHDGKYQQCHNLAATLGPLGEWEGAEAQVFAGRLAHNLGCSKLGRVMHRRAFATAPNDPSAQYFYLLSIVTRRGPWELWRRIRDFGVPECEDVGLRADWMALRAQAYASLRDFENAELWVQRALDLAPDRSWIWVERAVVHEIQDEVDEALAACQRALELRPWYRPAVQMTAYRLVQLNRDDEALRLLEEAVERLESGDVWAQLGSFYIELQRYEDARRAFDQVAAHYPIMDSLHARWLASRRSDTAYYCGDHGAAIEHARRVRTQFYDKFADRLAADGERRGPGTRVILPVTFVRQLHHTCVPATLTALSGYWSREVDQREVAEQICYEGTPAYKERRWAEESGYVVREFRVTEETTHALIDQGVPFALTTVNPGDGHSQAVIGYDQLRGTLLVRDPNERHFTEFDLREMLKHYGSTGPRALVFAPAEEARRLDGIDYPEAELYDLKYGVEGALHTHDRDEAQRLFDTMRRLAPDARLTHSARGTLSEYDNDPRGSEEAVDALLRLYPKDVNLQATKLSLLRELGTREQRLEMLRRLYEQPDCDALFWWQYAAELRADAQRFGEAEQLLTRTMRWRPQDGRAFGLLAEIRIDQGRVEEAIQLQRFGACLDDKDETRARVYFSMARIAGQTDEALRLLERRVERLGERSGMPAVTLAWAHSMLEHTERSFEVLEEALRRLTERVGGTPGVDDAEFLLLAADTFARYGRGDRAAELLEQARPLANPLHWHKQAAAQALYRADHRAALDEWRRVLELNPVDSDAHDQVAFLLGTLEGEQAAIDSLRAAVERFPRNVSLRRRLVEGLRERPSEQEVELRRLLEFQDDGYTRRELSIALLRLDRYDESFAEAELSIRQEPTNPAGHYLRGQYYLSKGDQRAAVEAFRESLRCSIDYDPSIHSLMECCDSKAERVEQLRFLYEQLQEQVIFGDGLLMYQERARATLDPEELLTQLREAQRARPDLWHADAAVVRQLVEMHRHEDARAAAEAATARFPMLPRLWLELARVCHEQERYGEEIEALERALGISPTWSDAARQLAQAHRAQGELDAAKRVLERALTLDPREMRNRGLLGDVLWQQEQREEAIAEMTTAVRAEPGFDAAWDRLRDWHREVGRPEDTLAVARELTESRPLEARSWLVLAECEESLEHWEACWDAARRAAELNPHHVNAWRMQVHSLAKLGRFDESLAAASPAPFGDDRPLRLVGAEAETRAAMDQCDEAERLMRHVVEQDPDAFWAWFRLAEWSDAWGRAETYAEASAQLVRIAPDYPVGWGYQGDALLRAGNRAEAERCFRRAVELGPDYIWAGRTLLENLIEDQRYQEAAELLEQLAEHWPPELACSQQVRVRGKLPDADGALEWFGRLAQLPRVSEDSWSASLEALTELGRGEAAEEILQGRVTAEDAYPELGRTYARLAGFNNHHDACGATLDAGLADGQVWRAAATEHLRQLASSATPGRASPFVARHAERLRPDPDCWSAAVQALLAGGDIAEARRWLTDWRRRDDLTPMSLLRPISALLRQGERDEALPLLQHAVQLPADDATPSLQVYVAAERLADAVSPADLATASESLAETEGCGLTTFCELLQSLATVTLAELGKNRSPSFKQARGRLQGVIDGHQGASDDVLLMAYLERFSERIARSRGALTALLYRWGRTLSKWFKRPTNG